MTTVERMIFHGSQFISCINTFDTQFSLIVKSEQIQVLPEVLRAWQKQFNEAVNGFVEAVEEHLKETK